MSRSAIVVRLIAIVGMFWVATANALKPSPSDSELMALGARIGNVSIQVDDVFETDRPLAAPYRVANALHVDTRPSAIAAQLLFQSGDLFDRRVLDESERILRSQRYLSAATIAVTTYDADSNTADLSVRVHDVWTLSPGISFGRRGGTNATRIELEENNLFGLGKRVELWRSQDVDRTSLRFRYLDRNLLSTRWQLSTAYVSSSDGGERTLEIARPFYALDAKWSAGVFATDETAAVSRYREGHLVELLNMRKRVLEFDGGISDGLQGGWVRRYLGGVRYERREFSLHEEQLASLPADRTLSYPWLGIEWIEDNYVTTRNHDLIARTEDIHLGVGARLEAGYASRAFGSTISAIMVGGSFSFGQMFGEHQTLLSQVSVKGRIENDGPRNSVLELRSRYYGRQNEYCSFYAGATVTLTRKLDAERQLTVGGDNGLRGYPLRFQSGRRSLLVSLEERFYTPWQPLKLFDLGAAVFVDGGRTWGSDALGAEPLGLLKDVGFGLRLGNARSALGNVLHLDVAFPLDGRSSISKTQFIVETRRSF